MLNVNFEAMEEKIEDLLRHYDLKEWQIEDLKKELLNLHSVMQSEFPPEYVRIACAEYYKRNTPLRAIKLVKKYTGMSATTAKAYCDAHFA